VALDQGVVAIGLSNFWTEIGCYILTNLLKGRRVGNIYKREPISTIAVYLEDLNLVKAKSL
jgi:hypothetical protein